jgi:uncharacterized coiled-coil DUF342 family protein|tara:strand:+ start:170 stop:457 length:288 start_codon:yes stop_codon:yes gene_type:complete
MSQEVKFSKQELERVKSLQDEYLSVQLGYGQVHVAEMQLNEQLDTLLDTRDELNKKLKNVREAEQNFIKEINDKYGDGVLNPETGIFTQNKSQDG